MLAVLLATVAVGSRAVLGAAGGPPATATPARIPVDAIALPLVLAMLAGLGFLATVLRPVRWRRRDPEQPDWVFEPPPMPWSEKALSLLVLLLLAGAVASAVWLFAPRGAPPQPAPPQATGRPAAPATVPPAPPAFPAAPSRAPWLWPAAGVAVLAAGAGLLAVRAAHRRGGSATSTSWPADRLADLLDDSTDDLRAQPDPRRAILAAYARMERAMRPSGAGRQRHETAMEYLDRLLARLDLEPGPLRRLTGLFELARFSDHQVTEAMRDRAVAALEAISASLRSPP